MLYRIVTPIRNQIKLSRINNYWASFDCDGCQKKIKDP